MLSIAKGVYRGGKGGSAPPELRSFFFYLEHYEDCIREPEPP